MLSNNTIMFVHARLLCALALCCLLFVTSALAQQTPAQQQPTSPAASPTPAPAPQQQPPAAEPEEVIRISTELVQTDVMVFDRQGRFVEGLQREQFELQVDGRPQAISFFEQVRAGTANEDAQLAAARGRAGAGESGARPLDRGRTIFFFVDDLHLSSESAIRVRQMIQRFIDEQMGQNDEVAIAAVSGQIGFLQQLTDNKAVLRAAIARLAPRNQTVGNPMERPPMTEYQALALRDNDRELWTFFVEATIRQHQLDGVPNGREIAERMVRSRADQLTEQSMAATRNTLVSLELLVRSLASMPGRKLVFFISDGFLAADSNSEARDRLRRLTDAGARTGTVIYSMDARGLSTGGGYDATVDSAFDMTGVIERSFTREMMLSQESLRALAEDTGGRAILNTNALGAAIPGVLAETSVYYLLAWTPEPSTERSNRFRRVEVRVKDRPDLIVRVRGGFFEQAPPQEPPRRDRARQAPASTTPRDNTPAAALRRALLAPFPLNSIPTYLIAGFINEAEGRVVVTASVQVDNDALQFDQARNAGSANLHVVSALYNDQGNVVSNVNQRFTIRPPENNSASESRLTYAHQLRVPRPGLYQVRVAARDELSGRTGSAMQWIEIPDLARGNFALSSLFVGERQAATNQPTSAQAAGAEAFLNPTRRFARSSSMRFLTYVYNATRAGGAQPDVAMQVQVFRDGQPIITTPLSRLNTAGADDLARIPYAAEIRLDDLPVGRYTLQVTAIDRAARKSSSQQLSFIVE